MAFRNDAAIVDGLRVDRSPVVIVQAKPYQLTTICANRYNAKMAKKRAKQSKPKDVPRWSWEISNTLNAGTELLATPSDRTCVIMGAALLDGALEMLLRHAFVARSGLSTEEADWLLIGSRAPLLSMGVRVRLARALDLIDDKSAAAILRLIDIRNVFAHQTLPDAITLDEATALWNGFPADRVEQINGQLAAIGVARTPRAVLAMFCISWHGMLMARADRKFGDMVPGERMFP